MYETLLEYITKILLLPKNTQKENWEEVFKAMAVHTRNMKPEESLLARRPNEQPNIHQYRLNNWRAITYGSMNKAVDDVYRIINGISYSINSNDSVKEFFRTGLVGEYCNHSTNELMVVKMFLESICLKRMIEDPNGFLIWIPTGEGLTKSSVKIVPQPKLILSKQFHYSDDNVFIWEDEEKTPLKDAEGNMKLEGKRFYLFTPTEYWTVYQTGYLSEPTWAQELIYTHNINAFPVITLGGEKNTDGYYESFFKPYLAFGDEAIHVFSDWQAAMCQSLHAIREEFVQECMLEPVNKQANNISDTEEEFQGKGNGKYVLKSLGKSPYDVIQRKIPTGNINTDDLAAEIPSIRFISPPIENPRYAGESWQLLIEKAEQALNIDMTVGVDQSGKAKQLDKEGQYSMISKIGTKLFDNIFVNSLKFIDCYLNRTTFEKSESSINKPTTFWVKNEMDLIQEISTLKTNNAPSFFLAEATNDLAKKRFNGNPVNQKVFNFISLYDPYFIYTVGEKQGLLASTIMTKAEFVTSLRMYGILQQLVIEMSADQFLKEPMDKIKEKFDTLIKPFLPVEPIVTVGPDGLPA